MTNTNPARASTIIAVILMAVLSSGCDLMDPPLEASHAGGLALNLRLYQPGLFALQPESWLN